MTESASQLLHSRTQELNQFFLLQSFRYMHQITEIYVPYFTNIYFIIFPPTASGLMS